MSPIPRTGDWFEVCTPCWDDDHGHCAGPLIWCECFADGCVERMRDG